MSDRKFEVPACYDGPWLYGRAMVTVAAQDEDDAQRQALTLVGPPKTGQPREIE